MLGADRQQFAERAGEEQFAERRREFAERRGYFLFQRFFLFFGLALEKMHDEKRTTEGDARFLRGTLLRLGQISPRRVRHRSQKGSVSDAFNFFFFGFFGGLD